MTIIIPHPTEELVLIRAQKKLIKELFEPGKIIYAHTPLWIPVDFESVEEAKQKIKDVKVMSPVADKASGTIICPVQIITDNGTMQTSLRFIESPDGQLKTNCSDAPDFPLDLKIFRLGECNSPSPNVYELKNSKWVKLT